LRVLTYNVHGQRDDTRALAAVVREVEPDVVIVQEAPRRFAWRHRCAALADSFGLVVAAGGLPALGNLLLTSLRVRVHDTWCLRYPLTPGRHLRGAVFASGSVDRARFVVTGSHLATDPVERPGQARVWKDAMARVEPVLIAGADLNEEPGGASWGIVADGLTDAGALAGPTFPATAARARIDAVFVDPRIVVSHCAVVDTPVARRASDHLPVLTDLLLPPG
jgi:endonuclease/exonuclease/phosphatase family metal-dependent hydrolase